ncbi:MAG: saccharopine dehydrogenase NADP-binding domain-containing protein [Pseudomonadota bacterium]
MSKREYDVIVWGATSFTGKWVAKHMFDHYGADQVRWCMAGRNAAKLAEISDFIGDKDQTIATMLADSNDMDSLRAMVKQTKSIITTVGPYAYYGSNLVQVCAEEGTHYVDLCGEVPWMREMIDTHLATAQSSGARIVHSCGFDSIPSDMGAFFMQKTANEKFGQPLKAVRYALLKSKGGMSGGTAHSMLNILKLAVEDKKVRKVLTNPYSLNPDPSKRGVDKWDQNSVKYSKELGRWTAPFLMAGINTRIVRRSNALMDNAYGDEFSYTETMATGKGASGYMTAKGISAAIKSMAVMSFTGVGRAILNKILPEQGEGPTVDPENPGFYIIQLNGETNNGDALVGKLKGDGDPGYGSTSKMLAESGISLALDDLDVEGGFWTPASAMGDALLTRLQDKGGLTFEIVS